ncbi:MAG: helix-turn-helix domain-containing protein [Pseudomonadota bacterium]
MAKIMTTKEVSAYLKLHQITVFKFAAQGKIPAIRIGRVWGFDKETIDRWIERGQNKAGTNDHDPEKTTPKNDGKKSYSTGRASVYSEP